MILKAFIVIRAVMFVALLSFLSQKFIWHVINVRDHGVAVGTALSLADFAGGALLLSWAFFPCRTGHLIGRLWAAVGRHLSRILTT